MIPPQAARGDVERCYSPRRARTGRLIEKIGTMSEYLCDGCNEEHVHAFWKR